MLDRLFYEDKGVLLQDLHTVTLLGYLGVLLVLALLFSHPLYLAAVLAAGALGVVAAGAQEKWSFYLKFGLGMALLLLIINAFASPAGATVVLRAGPLKLCLEAIVYGAVMGMRLVAVLTAFCLASATLHPDKLLALLSPLAYKSALVLALATRMLPAATRDLVRAREALEIRGVDFGTGSFMERLKKQAWLLDILLVSSLEGALDTAEAMQARALGSGPRSHYRRELPRPRDAVCLAPSLLALALSVYAKISGLGDYTYYPRLAPLAEGPSPAVAAAIFASLSVPAILSWGWKRWPCLRSRI